MSVNCLGISVFPGSFLIHFFLVAVSALILIYKTNTLGWLRYTKFLLAEMPSYFSEDNYLEYYVVYLYAILYLKNDL